MSKLLLLFAYPFVAAAVTLGGATIALKNLKIYAIILSLLPLILLLSDPVGWIGAEINYVWIPALSINFHLNVDALSLLFLCLSAFVVPLALTLAPKNKTAGAPFFYSLIFVLQGLLIGFFTARDLALFTIFWEAILLPLYMLIAYFGDTEGPKIALKFLIYMLAGSALMVAAVLALYFLSQNHSFDIALLAQSAAQLPHAAWICAIFMLAFAVKIPMFPFHAWLPNTYYQAPTAATILLAALLSKAGVYGLFRISWELFNPFMVLWSPWLVSLAIVGVIYGGLAAWWQNDFKRLLAYASFSHLNFILLGLFMVDQIAHSGAILQSINHGITITALLLASSWLAQRLGTTDMQEAGGLAKIFPKLCWFTLLFILAYMALPGTNNFVGELLILFGLFEQQPLVAVIAGATTLLTVIYMLRAMQKIYFGIPASLQNHKYVANKPDLSVLEVILAGILTMTIIALGLYPLPIVQIAEQATQNIADFNVFK